MPHYKDGTPAEIGDLVRGRGYNVKREISGVVCGVKEAETCNLVIAHMVPTVPGDNGSIVQAGPSSKKDEAGNDTITTTVAFVRIEHEYGEAAAFEKIVDDAPAAA